MELTVEQKAIVDKQIEDAKAEAVKIALKDLSAKTGLNLFEPEKTREEIESAKKKAETLIDPKEIERIKAEHQATLVAKELEIDALKVIEDAYKATIEESNKFKQDTVYKQSGVKENYRPRVEKLVKTELENGSLTFEGAVEKVKKEFGVFFNESYISGGTDKDGKKKLTEREEYILKNYPKK